MKLLPAKILLALKRATAATMHVLASAADL
jgi:hypothetical protein